MMNLDRNAPSMPRRSGSRIGSPKPLNSILAFPDGYHHGRTRHDNDETMTRILHSGFCVMAYRSFTEDVLGQIHRLKLELSHHRNKVLRLLPAIEEALHRNDFLYEHSGLGLQHANQMSVISRKGMLYRLAIIPQGEDDGSFPSLHLDTSWIERRDPVSKRQHVATLSLTPDVRPFDIDRLFAGVPQ